MLPIGNRVGGNDRSWPISTVRETARRDSYWNQADLSPTRKGRDCPTRTLRALPLDHWGGAASPMVPCRRTARM